MHDGVDKDEATGAEAEELHRGDMRDSLLLKAMVRFSSTGEVGEVRVRNLSAGGLMAEASVMARRGELVEVSLRNLGWIAGKIAWVAEGRFGIAFECIIDPKLARKPTVSANDDSMPVYLRKLNQGKADRSPLRTIS